MLILEEIYIYPIKSLPGVRVKASAVKEKGLEYDRRVMLVDATGNFLTQRTLPILSQFTTGLEGRILNVQSKSNPGRKISIDLNGPFTGEKLLSRVWEDEVETIEIDPALSSWFSLEISMPCKLVYFPEDSERIADPDYVPQKQQVSLSDGFPFLIVGRESLRDLNTRLSAPITMNRFRPNLVFSGGQPYQEDTFNTFKIGQVIFKGVKPCSRCIFTTVDPVTGITGKEPLQTLSGYRKRNNQIYFGMNLITLNEQTIHEGDEIHLS